MEETGQWGKMSKAYLDECLEKPVLARLATVNLQTCQPHVVPVWYGWDGEALYISAFRSTRKVKELQENPRCSVVIDTQDAGEGMFAIIFEGKAELITAPSDFLEEKTTWVYERYLGPEGVLEPDPQSWIRDPENLLICLKPEKTYSWFTEKQAALPED